MFLDECLVEVIDSEDANPHLRVRLHMDETDLTLVNP